VSVGAVPQSKQPPVLSGHLGIGKHVDEADK